MRLRIRLRQFCYFVLSVVAAVAMQRQLPADEAVIDVSGYANSQEALRAGEQYETSRQWIEAIEFYEKSLKRWEKDQSLSYALRRTRIHFGIDRRYTDRSFEEKLLKQGRSESLDLFQDILDRIQLEYVDTISVTRFVAHGTESLYMALGNERFLSHNIPENMLPGAEKLRETLRQEYWNRRLASRAEARSLISRICDLSRRECGLDATAVVMEFIFGGCNALDEYSNFLTPDRYSELFGSIQGELVGIGIEMKAVKGRGMHLVNVLLDSPAEDGGLRPEDHIVEIDGSDCRDISIDEAARLLKGPGGTRVTLTWEQPSGARNSGSFTRRRVHIRSVTRSVILDSEKGIGYIRQEGFQNSTVEELDEALRSLERQGMKALIWDLRNNPGGLLETAAAVVDRFIDDGVIVTTRGRSSEQNQVFPAHPNNTRQYPLVLLVDENSASASEIVAGAIHDHKRGVIVGRKTYGKWSVQSIIHLSGDTGLKLTTARFYSPSNGNFSGTGLAPDVEVPQPENALRTYYRGRKPDELLADEDIARAMDVLEQKMFTRK